MVGGYQELEKFLKKYSDKIQKDLAIDSEDGQNKELDDDIELSSKDQVLPQGVQELVTNYLKKPQPLHLQVKEEQAKAFEENAEIINVLYEDMNKYKFLKKSNSFLDKDLGQLHNSFTGSSLVDYLTSKFGNKFQTRTQAVDFAKYLQQYRILSPIVQEFNDIKTQKVFEDDVFQKFKFVKDSTSPAKGEPLNLQYYWFGAARHPQYIAQDLQSIILELFDRYVSTDGKTVEYKALIIDPLFQDYLIASNELHKADVQQLNRQQKIAFFVNIYNIMVIHAQALNGMPKNMSERLKMYGEVNYVIGGYKYSCNDIEHGILRGDKSAPSLMADLYQRILMVDRPYFQKNDPRKEYKVYPVDPRIHFALNCGALSCPAISVYDQNNLDFGLDCASENFVDEGGIKLDTQTSVITLSMIFKWYESDFGANQRSVLNYMKGYTKDKEAYINEVVISEKLKIKYEKYNWSGNNA